MESVDKKTAYQGDALMRRLRGTIKEGDEVILENVEILLTEIKPPLGLQEWRGTFKLQEFRYFEPGQQYTLILEDGRSGQIIVSGETISPPFPASVRFQGSGDLK